MSKEHQIKAALAAQQKASLRNLEMQHSASASDHDKMNAAIQEKMASDAYFELFSSVGEAQTYAREHALRTRPSAAAAAAAPLRSITPIPAAFSAARAAPPARLPERTTVALTAEDTSAINKEKGFFEKYWGLSSPLALALATDTILDWRRNNPTVRGAPIVRAPKEYTRAVNQDILAANREGYKAAAEAAAARLAGKTSEAAPHSTRGRSPTRTHRQTTGGGAAAPGLPEEGLPALRSRSRGRTPVRSRSVGRSLSELAPIDEESRRAPLTDLERFTAAQTPLHVRELFERNPLEAIARYPTETQTLRFVPEEHARAEPEESARAAAPPQPRYTYDPANLTNDVLHSGVPADPDRMSMQGTPAWLGGPSGFLKQYMHRQLLESNKPYERYTQPTIAELSRPQLEAYKMVHDLANDAYGVQAQTEENLGRTIGNTELPFYQEGVLPFIHGGTQKITPEEVASLNPYSEEYLGRLEARKREKFEREVLPRIQAQLVGKGAINTGARSHFIREALAENERQIAEQLDELRHKGRAMGLTEAGHGRERLLSGAHHATVGQLGERAQAAEAAKLYQEANRQHNAHAKSTAAALAEQGAIHQVEAQRKLDEDRAEHNRARLHDIEQQQRAGQALRGLPDTTSTVYSVAKPEREPFASPYTAAGSLLGTMTGLANERKQKGGRVKKAGGGSLQIPQEIDYINAMNSRVGQLESQQHSPFWSGYTNLMANIGASKRKNLAGAVSESLPAMATGWREAAQRNEVDTDRALAIRHAYVQSLQLQKERELKHQLDREDLDMKKKHYAGMDRLHALQAEEYEQKLQGLKNPVELPGIGKLRKLSAHEQQEKDKYLAERAEEAHKFGAMSPHLQKILEVYPTLAEQGINQPGSLLQRAKKSTALLAPTEALSGLARWRQSPKQKAATDIFEKETQELATEEATARKINTAEGREGLRAGLPSQAVTPSATYENVYGRIQAVNKESLARDFAYELNSQLEGNISRPLAEASVAKFFSKVNVPRTFKGYEFIRDKMPEIVRDILYDKPIKIEYPKEEEEVNILTGHHPNSGKKETLDDVFRERGI